MTKSRPVIFVVDDDESVRRALQRLLKSAGFAVETFASAEYFLKRTHHDAPGCLLLDVRMPGLSGLDLQKRLAASGSTMPIIFMTAHDDEEARSEALKSGAVAFLLKPFEERALLDAIRGAIGQNSPDEREGGDL